MPTPFGWYASQYDGTRMHKLMKLDDGTLKTLCGLSVTATLLQSDLDILATVAWRYSQVKVQNREDKKAITRLRYRDEQQCIKDLVKSRCKRCLAKGS